MSQAPHRIVILGGGTAGWMAANLMVKQWRPERVQVTVVESPEIGIIGVGEGSTPTLKRFFKKIEVPESRWMPRCNATYKLNIRFAGWSPNSGADDYSHPFISQLDSFNERAFVVNCRTRRLGLDVTTRPDLFLLNGVLARQNKGPLTPASFPFRMEYGYHFDSGLLGQFLAQLAVGRGVRHLQAKVVAAERNAAGDIDHLLCADGARVEADFFVDCSGFTSLLLQQTLGVKFNSFKSNLFNDAAVVMPTDKSAQLPVETLSQALSNGWCWHIPLTNRTGNGYVYSSDFISADDAETELRAHLGMLDRDVPARHLKMKVGQLAQHWSHNCLGLGLAQGFIEPLEATALHLVQLSVEDFIRQYDEAEFSNRGQEAFNRSCSERFERVRDYIVAHYKLNSRNDSDYWRANRDHNNISDSLYQLLQVWFQQGDMAAEFARQKIDSHFGILSWHCLLAGYGTFPGLAAGQPGQGDLYHEREIGAFLQGCSLNFASHEQCLAQR